jgi:hypothetical protein
MKSFFNSFLKLVVFYLFISCTVYAQDDTYLYKENLFEQFMSGESADWKAVCSNPDYTKLCTELKNELLKKEIAGEIINSNWNLNYVIEGSIKYFGEDYVKNAIPEYKEVLNVYKNWAGFIAVREMFITHKIYPKDYPSASDKYINMRSTGSGSVEAFLQLFLADNNDIERLTNKLKSINPKLSDDDLNKLLSDFFENSYHEKLLSEYKEKLDKMIYSSENMASILKGQILSVASKMQSGLKSETFTIPYNVAKDYFTNDVLPEGVTYLVTVSGSVSCWRDHTDGVDAVYCYGKWRCPDKPENWGIIRLNGNSLTDIDRSIDYNDSHVYKVKIKGNGQKLKIFPYDGGGYDDNNGSFTVTITKE